MKKFTLILTLAVALVACKSSNDQKNTSVDPENITSPQTANGSNENGSAPVITFTEEMHDFGNINEGEIVKHSFTFHNTGTADLLIANASASCGCTVPAFSKETVKPGQEGKIDVEFNSTGKTGQNEKQVTVTYNGIPNTKVISIKANVIPKK